MQYLQLDSWMSYVIPFQKALIIATMLFCFGVSFNGVRHIPRLDYHIELQGCNTIWIPETFTEVFSYVDILFGEPQILFGWAVLEACRRCRCQIEHYPWLLGICLAWSIWSQRRNKLSVFWVDMILKWLSSGFGEGWEAKQQNQDCGLQLT